MLLRLVLLLAVLCSDSGVLCRQSWAAKQPSEVCPVCTTNLCFLRVRVGDEGRGVKRGQRDSQIDVNPVYYVFGHLWHLHDATTFMQEICCYYVLSLFATVLLLGY